MSRGSSEGVLVMFMLQTEGTHVTCFHLYKSNGMLCLRKRKTGEMESQPYAYLYHMKSDCTVALQASEVYLTYMRVAI